MKVYVKCQYCRHATGSRISIDDVSRDWQTLGKGFRHELPHFVSLQRGALPDAYHLDCKEAYESWYRIVMTHKTQCHLENCPHSPAYPFRRFKLPFSISPTTLGDPVKPPEEVKRLLRL